MGGTMEARTALRVFGITGAAAVLVDLDHAYAVLLRLLESWVSEGRVLHPLVLIVAGGVFVYLAAYAGRLYVRWILAVRRERNNEN